MPTFHTSAAGLKRHFLAESRRLAFTGTTRDEALTWQKIARIQLASLLGLDKFQRCAPTPQLVSSTEIDGLIREEWRIQTEPEVWMPYYLFAPAEPPLSPMPLVLCPHGHYSAGKWATGGRRDIDGMNAVIERYNYDYGLQFARRGCITVCPDARGFGERRELCAQTGEQGGMLDHSCAALTLAGAPLGMPVQGMWTWDLMRLLDHLRDDPRIDANRVGCAGLSGGGMQTLDLAAIDTRIKAAVVSGYFYGVRESLQVLNTNCLCNCVPHLWESFDMGDIGALSAPRGLFIETGDEDELNGESGVANVISQLEIARRVYDALGAADKIGHHVFHGGHRWDGSRSIPWLMEQLGS